MGGRKKAAHDDDSIESGAGDRDSKATAGNPAQNCNIDLLLLQIPFSLIRSRSCLAFLVHLASRRTIGAQSEDLSA